MLHVQIPEHDVALHQISGSTVALLYPEVPRLWIQPTVDGEYLGNKVCGSEHI